MGDDKSTDTTPQSDDGGTSNSIPWVTISTSLIGTLLAISTIFMHSWMVESGSVEINTPQLQGKEVDWSLNYGLWESISHFGEEIETTDYDCGNSEADCKGVKTAGMVAISLIIIGTFTSITGAVLTFKSKNKDSKTHIRLSGIGGIIFFVTPIIWMVILPGMFPPIDGMHLGAAFWIILVSGIIATGGGIFGCITKRGEA